MTNDPALQRAILRVGREARAAGQALSPAHLFVHTLRANHARTQLVDVLRAGDRIAVEIIPRTVLGAVRDDALDATFQVTEAMQSCREFLERRRFEGTPEDGILWWLLAGEFDDRFGLARLCRKLCQVCNVTATVTMQVGPAENRGSLGFGRLVLPGSDLPEADRAVDAPLVGREEELRKQLGFLRIAILQQRHYLLVGGRGVGKTRFAQALLHLAALRFAQEDDARFRSCRFIWLSPADFTGPAEQVEERFGRLVAHLEENPGLCPVFDGLEFLLQPTLAVYETFVSSFGGAIFRGRRTFVLICDADAARQAEILRPLRPQTLPALSREAAAEVAREVLGRLAGAGPTKLECDAAGLGEQIVLQARERYPDRFLPEIAIHLARSVVDRAMNRVRFLGIPPLDRLTSNDLWEHVAEELSIDAELMGKDPTVFYQRLRAGLKLDVIGQDHAIDLLVDALDDQRRSPISDAPRGRFLMLGPPGVGKTQLARSLARRLGYDQEAFFVLNMSEYSTDGSRTRFVGSDPGFVGYGQTRTIYDAARSRPSCVILLDEIDRAHPSIQDILLSILEGRGNDAQGRMVAFSQTIFVMTTNLGQEQIERAYTDGCGRGLSRGTICDSFSDDRLRELLQAAVVDSTEIAMKANLDRDLAAIRDSFQGDAAAGSPDAIREYLGLQELRRALELQRRHASLDRAFLDRIDFLIPFFPVREPENIRKIIDLKCKASWPDCPEADRRYVQELVAQENGSVRMIERLIKRLRLRARGATAPIAAETASLPVSVSS